MPDLTDDARALLAARHTEPTEDGLPALPGCYTAATIAGEDRDLFTKEQMHDYAREALAERHTEPRVEFFDEFNCAHSMSIADAAETLRQYENAWPGGLDEINSSIEHWRSRALAASAPPSRHLTDEQLLRALHSVTPAVSPDLTAERGGVLVPSGILRDLAAAILREAGALSAVPASPAEPTRPASELTLDQHIELASALEVQRALRIVSDVSALPIGGKDADLPTQFHAGYQLACEEITERIRTEVHVLPGELTLPQCGTLPSLRQPADTSTSQPEPSPTQPAAPAVEAPTRGEVPGHPLPDWPDDLKTFAERAAYQRGISDARRMAAAESCDHCHGTGQRYWHSPDCADDLCALNGDEHSCVGQLEDCPCRGAEPAAADEPATVAADPELVLAFRRTGLDRQEAVDAARATARLEAEQKAEPSAAPGAGWISVEERLPELDAPVLAYAGNRTVAVLTKRPPHQPGFFGWRRHPFTDTDGWLEVSHWLALPPAPAGEGERSC